MPKLWTKLKDKDNRSFSAKKWLIKMMLNLPREAFHSRNRLLSSFSSVRTSPLLRYRKVSTHCWPRWSRSADMHEIYWLIINTWLTKLFTSLILTKTGQHLVENIVILFIHGSFNYPGLIEEVAMHLGPIYGTFRDLNFDEVSLKGRLSVGYPACLSITDNLPPC